MNHVISSFAGVAFSAGTMLMRQQGSGRSGMDLESQTIIASYLHKYFPKFPLLFEEGDIRWVKQILKECPEIWLLDGSDSNSTLPPTYITVDPLDGSVLYESGCPEFSVSIGLVENGQPKYSVVFQPAKNVLVSSVRGAGCLVNSDSCSTLRDTVSIADGLVGLDLCRAVPPWLRKRFCYPLLDAFRYVRNLPSVASGVELVLGRTLAWVTTQARNWDVGAIVLAVLEVGGTAECLIDGKPIPWNQVKMPPLLLCANPSVRQQVREVLER